MRIGTREVGPGRPTFIIAEIGSNHAGSLDLALSLINAAAEAGADAAKFQYFRINRFLVPRLDPEALRKYELPDAWLPQLKARCTERGIEFLCTAFDLRSLDVVDQFVNAHKIGSAEATSDTYTWAVVSKGKGVLRSNGWLREWTYLGNSAITLHCVSAYPAAIDGYLRDRPVAEIAWGVSDHTLDPLTVPCAAVALGACVVEKHVRVDYGPEAIASPDHQVSITIGEFRDMVAAIRKTERAIR